MRTVLSVSLMVLLGCPDASEPTLREAKREYAALLESGTPARATAFTRLAEKLRAIPADSSSWREAQALVRAIETAQRSVVEQPLAIVPRPLSDGATPDEKQLAALRAEAQRMTEALSRLEFGEERRRSLEHLKAIQRRIQLGADAALHGASSDGGHF